MVKTKKEAPKKEAKKAKVDKNYIPREMIIHREDEKEAERLRLERLK